jgi:hypothetical protein
MAGSEGLFCLPLLQAGMQMLASLHPASQTPKPVPILPFPKRRVTTRLPATIMSDATQSRLITTDVNTGKLVRRQCVLTCLGGALASSLQALPASAFSESEWKQLVQDEKLTQQAYNVLHNSGTVYIRNRSPSYTIGTGAEGSEYQTPCCVRKQRARLCYVS